MSQPQTGLFEYGHELVNKGYNIIPITPNQKYPSIGKGWQNLCSVQAPGNRDW